MAVPYLPGYGSWNVKFEIAGHSIGLNYCFRDCGAHGRMPGREACGTISGSRLRTFGDTQLAGVARRKILLYLSKHGQQVGLSENRNQSYAELQGRSGSEQSYVLLRSDSSGR